MTPYDHGRNVGLEEAANILENWLSVITMEAIKSSANLVEATEMRKKLTPTIYQIREQKKK
jgi:hypothetical protein